MRQFGLTAQVNHDLGHGVLVEPVIESTTLVAARRVRQSHVHRRSATAVFLMDGADQTGVTLLPRIGLGGRVASWIRRRR